MNGIDQMIGELERREQMRQDQVKSWMAELTMTGMRKFEETLEQVLGENWKSELEAGTPWERFTGLYAVKGSGQRDVTVAMQAEVYLEVAADHLRLGNFRLQVTALLLADRSGERVQMAGGSEERGEMSREPGSLARTEAIISAGRVRLRSVIGRVGDDSMRDYALPGEFGGMMQAARRSWVRSRIDQGRKWLLGNVYERFQAGLGNWKGLEVGSQEWRNATYRAQRQAVVLRDEGTQMMRDLIELAPEMEDGWRKLLEAFVGEVNTQAARVRAEMEWMERKPVVLSEYREALRVCYAERKRAVEHNQALIREVQEALDEPFMVYRVKFGVLINDASGDWWMDQAWSMDEGPDEEGYWKIVDRNDVVRKRVMHVALVDEGIEVVASKRDDIAGCELSQEFGVYVQFQPGKREEAVRLIQAAASETAAIPNLPEEPKGQWGWTELSDLRKLVMNEQGVEETNPF